MRRGLGVVALLTGVWLFAAPWLYRTPMATTGGHMTGMTHRGASQFVLTASTYYWHIVPGLLTVLIAAAVVLFDGRLLMCWLAVALGVLALWSVAGPWVLPQFGMGDMMMSGVTTASFLRHILPGAVMAFCALGVFFSVPARSLQAARSSAHLQS